MTGALLALGFVALVIYLLVKKYNAIALLLFSGLVMLASAYALGLETAKLKNPTGLLAFDFAQYIVESLMSTMSAVGLVIMIISGFVA